MRTTCCGFEKKIFLNFAFVSFQCAKSNNRFEKKKFLVLQFGEKGKETKSKIRLGTTEFEAIIYDKKNEKLLTPYLKELRRVFVDRATANVDEFDVEIGLCIWKVFTIDFWRGKSYINKKYNVSKKKKKKICNISIN